MKTSDLIGVSLDWAVAKCEGATNLWYDTVATHWITLDGKDRALSKGWAQSYLPSTDWAQGGPIIERARIGVEPWGGDAFWVAMTYSETGMTLQKKFGSKPLIAAMRCYVASRLGDDVEIPEELK